MPRQSKQRRNGLLDCDIIFNVIIRGHLDSLLSMEDEPRFGIYDVRLVLDVSRYVVAVRVPRDQLSVLAGFFFFLLCFHVMYLKLRDSLIISISNINS